MAVDKVATTDGPSGGSKTGVAIVEPDHGKVSRRSPTEGVVHQVCAQTGNQKKRRAVWAETFVFQGDAIRCGHG
jgi:hypothetical protein